MATDSQNSDSPLVVFLEAQNDRRIDSIKSWSIDSDYMVSTDGFEFTAVASDPEELRSLEGEPVRLTVGGALQVVGRIDRSQRGDSGFAVSFSGRDYIADLVECNIDPTFVIKEKETLGSAILRGCEPIGIKKVADHSDANVLVDIRTGLPGKTRARKGQGGKYNRSKKFKDATLDDLKPDIGQGIFEFFSPLCARHGCTIQPTHQRDMLLIGGPFYEQEPKFMIIRSRTDIPDQNNVIRATATRDFSSFPSLLIVQGQGAPRSGEKITSTNLQLDAWFEAKQYGGELGETLNWITYSGRRKPGAIEDELPIEKLYRLNMFRDDKARNPVEVENAMRRLFAEHLKKSLEYRVQLRGHVDPRSGALWSHDTIVHVYDETCDILGEELWVQSRRFSYSESGGPTTDLVCVRPGSFEI